MRPRRGEPKWLRLKRSEEKRILSILAQVPDTEPEVEILPYDGPEFEVGFREGRESYVPLEIGAEGLYADYSVQHNLLEATFLKIARRVRIRGMWHFEVNETGGTRIDEQFGIIWHGPHYYRVSSDYTYRLDMIDMLHWYKSRTRFKPPIEVQWSDPVTATGTEAREGMLAGYNLVRVDGREFECARILTVTKDEEQSNDIDLDDAYINHDGRTVLLRHYLSAGHSYMANERIEDADKPSETPELCYNGVAFHWWFDTLTDVALTPARTT